MKVPGIYRYLFVLIVSVFLVFSQTLRAGFLDYDDPGHLINNPATTSLKPAQLKEAFTRHVQKVYIPLTTLSFAVERSLFGLNPFVYHLDNLLLHIANSVIVLLIALRFNMPLMGAFFAAMIFGLHPMRVESVAWITERKDVLCALFYLLALWQWIIYRQESRRSSVVWAHVFVILSLLAKPMAISLPFAFCCVDWFLGRRFNREFFVDKAGVFALCASIGWITYQQHVRNPIDDVATGIQSWVTGLGFYWQKFFVPLNLIPIYPIPVGSALLLESCLSFVLIFAIVWLAFQNCKDRLLVFALLFYVSTIFFLLRVDTRADIHWVADRFMYIPSIGICLWLGSYFSSRRRIGIIVLVFLGVMTWSLIPIWKDSLSFWNGVIKKSPREMIAYFNRAGVYQDLRQFDKAAADYTTTIELLKESPPRQVISVISKEEGGQGKVLIKPWHLNETEIKYNRAIALLGANRFDEALDDINEVIALYQGYDKGYFQRGLVFSAKGKPFLAIADFSKCIEINHDNDQCFSARGNVFNKLNQWFDALADYNRALTINPQFAQAYNNRAIIYMALSMPDKAILDFNRSVANDRYYGDAYYNRSIYYYTQQKYHESLVDVLEASRLGVLIPDKYYQDLMRLNHLDVKK